MGGMGDQSEKANGSWNDLKVREEAQIHHELGHVMVADGHMNFKTA